MTPPMPWQEGDANPPNLAHDYEVAGFTVGSVNPDLHGILHYPRVVEARATDYAHMSPDTLRPN
ncbi:hypothetical protein D1872_295380 [compost metagenome]